MKKVLNVIVVVVLFIFLYQFMSWWYYGRMASMDGFNSHRHQWSEEELASVGKDFLPEGQNQYISTSPDPWFTVRENYSVKTVVIDVDFISDKRNAQFFALSDIEEVQDTSRYFVLKEGTNFIQIPRGDYNIIRLDLTESEGVSLKIKSLVTYGNRVHPSSFWGLLFFLWGILVWLFYDCIYKSYRISNYCRLSCQKLGEYRFYRRVLVVLIGITALFVYGKIYLSGHQYVYYDIGGGDEPELYFPIFVSYIEKIRNGTFSTWNFDYGLGVSTLSIVGYLINPFVCIILLSGIFFGISAINSSVMLAQILNIFLCGILCYKYLKNFKGSYFSKMVASYICAFCGYIVLFSQHYISSCYLFYFLLMLIVIEDVLSATKTERHFVYLTICTALVFCCGVYMAYMIGIFLAIYVLFRLIQIYSIKEIHQAFDKLFHIIGFVFIGILLSMPFIIPNIYGLMNSGRIGGGISLSERIKEFLLVPYPVQALKTIFLRLISNNFEGAGNDFMGSTGNYAPDYYTAPELFFSIFIIAFVIVYLVSVIREKECRKKDKLLKIIIVCLVSFTIFNRLGSAAFNAFVATFERYTYLLMPLFAIATVGAVDELLNRKKSGKLSWLIGVLFTFIIVFCQYRNNIAYNDKRYLLILMAVEMLILLAAMVLVVLSEKMRRVNYLLGLAVLVVLSIAADSYVTVNERVFCPFSEDLTDKDDYGTQMALEYIADYDNGIYRTEKDYYDLIPFNDSMFQGYKGVSTYNSTLNSDVKEFFRLYCSPSINFYGEDSFWYSYMNNCYDVLQSSLLGIKYFLTNDSIYDNQYYDLVYQQNGINVYENTGVDSFGIFYENAVAKSEIENLDYINRIGVLSKAIVVEKEYADRENIDTRYEEVVPKPTEIGNLAANIKLINNVGCEYLFDGNCIHTKSDMNAVLEISLEDIPELSSDEANKYLTFYSDIPYSENINIYFNTGKGYRQFAPYYFRGSSITQWQGAKIMLPSDVQSIKFVGSSTAMSIKDLKVIEDGTSLLPCTAILEAEYQKDSCIRFRLDTDKEGYLFVPIPYEAGWFAKLDGRKTEIIQADSGFMAVKISQGKHLIEFNYSYPYIVLGIIAFIIGFILLFGVIKFKKIELINKNKIP